MILRAVIFDLGGVVNRWDPERAAPGVLRHDFAAFAQALDGGTDPAAAIAAAPEAARTDFAAYVANIAEAHAEPVPGTAEIIEALHARGLRLIAMSNAAEIAWAALAGRHPVCALFDDVFLSGREGVSKPDAAAYARVIARNALTPAETLFVDDKPANVAGAEAVGLRGHVFTDAPALRAMLTAEGRL